MLSTNADRLIKQSVTGQVHNPVIRTADTRTDNNGIPFALPTVGGICYNFTLGDCVYSCEGDHIEPCVSLKNPVENEDKALNFLSCIGNKARVMTGDAKGRTGRVIGKHAGIEHVIVWFDEETLYLLCPGDVILIESYGQGLSLDGYPAVHVKNVDPLLFNEMGISENKGGLSVPVKAVIPAYLMGSGMGYASSWSGDYDIMTGDKNEIARLKLDNLAIGDVVFLKDCDTRFGRGYRRGASTVGVIIHSDCRASGHGPGVTTVMSSACGILTPRIDSAANIGGYSDIFKRRT